MGETIDPFPLFPLGIVLLPGEAVPLHIFEERYKTMIEECMEGDSEFGVVWLSGEKLADIGCAARVTQMLERFDDGRLNILIEGTDPVRIDRRIDNLAYPAGAVERLDDSASEPSAGPAEVARAAYADLVERVTDERPGDEDLEALSAYEMAATIAFEPGPKQELLELRHEDERMACLTKLCAEALERVERSGEIAEVASSNGHLRSA